MKGDLGTLRKICLYASKVMLAGEIALTAVAVASVVLAAGSALSDSLADLVASWSGFVYGTADPEPAELVQTVFILVLGAVTVDHIRRLMDSFRGSHSPFEGSNAGMMRRLSLCYLASAFVLLALEALSGASVAEMAFFFLGTLMICVVLYCLSIVFRYGSMLQNESDHTL